MSSLSLDELIEIFRECGVDADVDLSSDILDMTLTDLGFDSLAAFHIHTVVEERTGVACEESEFADLQTPRDILARVNSVQNAA